MTEEEIAAVAAHVGLDEAAFIQRHTRLMPDRRSLSLVEKDDGSCVFVTPDNRCDINDVKPKQCRDFPDVWNFPGYEQVCRAKQLPDPDGSNPSP